MRNISDCDANKVKKRLLRDIFWFVWCERFASLIYNVTENFIIQDFWILTIYNILYYLINQLD